MTITAVSQMLHSSSTCQSLCFFSATATLQWKKAETASHRANPCVPFQLLLHQTSGAQQFVGRANPRLRIQQPQKDRVHYGKRVLNSQRHMSHSVCYRQAYSQAVTANRKNLSLKPSVPPAAVVQGGLSPSTTRQVWFLLLERPINK